MSKDTKIKDTIRVVVDYLDNDLKEQYFAKGCAKSEGAIPKSREYISFFADEACVEPCKFLYDLGLQTVNSGANVCGRENVSDDGFIGVNYLSMSSENKAIADELEQKGLIETIEKDPNQRGAFEVYLRVPLTSDSTVGEVEEQLMRFATLFQPQDVLYGRKSFEDMFKDNGDGTYYSVLIGGNIDENEVTELLNEETEDLFYDGNKYYYVTEELLNIHLSYIDKNEKRK